VAALALVAVADLALAVPDIWRLHRADSPSTAELLTARGRARVISRIDGLTTAARRVNVRVRRSPLLAVPGVRGWTRQTAARTVSAAVAAQRAARAGDALVRGAGPVTPGALDAFARRLDQAATRVAAVPTGSEVALQLHIAAGDVWVVGGLLGGNGPRRYLVGLQNNAEMRDQGMVLSYAEITIDNGRFILGPHGSVTDLLLHEPVAIAVPDGTASAFGPIGLNQLWESVNATADFPWSAQVMAAMYEKATGRAVDGVWTLDVPALARLLRATGPVDVDGLDRPLTAASAPSVLLHDIYEGVAPREDGDRRRILAGAMEAVMARVADGAVDRTAVVEALVRGVATGHVRGWSPQPGEARPFARWRADGVIARNAIERSRTFHVAVENRTATKLDYYVDVNTDVRVRMTGHGTALVRTTVQLVNRAPIGAAPSYQLGPDGFGGTATPGDYIGWVLLWAPAGASQPEAVADAGLQLAQETVVVAAGQRRRVTFETAIPDAGRRDLVLRFAPQPRLHPGALRVSGPGVHRGGSWDRDVRVVFAASASGAGPLSMRWLLTLTALLLIAVFVPVAPSRAQQYPPSPTTTAPGVPVTNIDGSAVTTPDGVQVTRPAPTTGPAATTKDGKPVPVTTTTQPVRIPGDSVTQEVCTYKPSSPVAIALNGATALMVDADTNGCLAPQITITSCEPPVITIGAARLGARLGSNTVSFTGTSSTGRTASQATQLNIACKRPAKKRNLLPAILVGCGVVALLATGVLVEARNRRRMRSA
jgi:hypothetical protein